MHIEFHIGLITLHLEYCDNPVSPKLNNFMLHEMPAIHTAFSNIMVSDLLCIGSDMWERSQ